MKSSRKSVLRGRSEFVMVALLAIVAVVLIGFVDDGRAIGKQTGPPIYSHAVGNFDSSLRGGSSL